MKTSKSIGADVPMSTALAPEITPQPPLGAARSGAMAPALPSPSISSGGTSQNPSTTIAAKPTTVQPPPAHARGSKGMNVAAFSKFNPDNQLPKAAFHGKR